ncbi:hypothetical protein IV102_30340 [bacterium]|nr:hypothetical protein [bacterium]
MSELWHMVSSYNDLEPGQLAAAVREERELHDPRTRQLVAESTQSLRGWNVALPPPPNDVEPVTKFPSLKRRIGVVTTAEKIMEFLRKISARLGVECRMVIGGASALILDHLIQRITHDVDVVDEIPSAIREMREEMAKAEEAYGLHLAHFQSHYLPERWEERLISLPRMRRLQAYRVHSLDVFVGKLFSGRDKDARDLAALSGNFDRERVQEHLHLYGSKLWADENLRPHLQENWYVVYGEELNFAPGSGTP